MRQPFEMYDTSLYTIMIKFDSMMNISESFAATVKFHLQSLQIIMTRA